MKKTMIVLCAVLALTATLAPSARAASPQSPPSAAASFNILSWAGGALTYLAGQVLGYTESYDAEGNRTWTKY